MVGRWWGGGPDQFQGSALVKLNNSIYKVFVDEKHKLELENINDLDQVVEKQIVQAFHIS